MLCFVFTLLKVVLKIIPRFQDCIFICCWVGKKCLNIFFVSIMKQTLLLWAFECMLMFVGRKINRLFQRRRCLVGIVLEKDLHFNNNINYQFYSSLNNLLYFGNNAFRENLFNPWTRSYHNYHYPKKPYFWGFLPSLFFCSPRRHSKGFLSFL